MTNTSVESIYNDSKKIYRQITNKEFLKWFYIIFLFSLGSFVVMIIAGLSVPINPSGQIILFTGVGIGVASLISFYIVEYIRRKALNYYKTQFTFANLYSEYLYQEKLIDTPLQLDADFDNSFFRQQLEVFSREYEFVNLHKNYATYKVFIKQIPFHISYCNATVVEKNSKILSSNKKAFHMIIASNYSGNLEGVICKNNKYRLEQIDAWKKHIDKSNDVYSDRPIKEWNSYIKLFNKINEKGMNLIEIKIKSNKIFYTFDFSNTSLLIGLANVKFYKMTWQNIFDQYANLRNEVKDIFEFIQIQQK